MSDETGQDSRVKVARPLRWFFWAGNATCWLLLVIFGFKSDGNPWAHTELIVALVCIVMQPILYFWSGTSPARD
jgi:hypothetical protein